MSATISDPRFARLAPANERPRLEREAKRKAEKKPRLTANTPVPRGFEKIDLEDRGEFWQGACPACQELGKDKYGNHMRVYEDGWPVCMAFQGEAGKEHRARIRKLLKLKGKAGFKTIKRLDTSEAEASLRAAFEGLWATIKSEFSGDIPDLGPSGHIPAEPKEHFLSWARLCFRPGDLVWGGTRGDWSELSKEVDRISGKSEGKEYPAWRSFARHCFDPEEAEAAWEIIQRDGCDHTSGVSWKDPSKGRISKNIAYNRILGVEHDDADWPSQIALWRYCQQVLKMDLLAVVDTTNKGGHGHFDANGLSTVRIREIISTLQALGADPNVLERSSTRIPGAIRQKDWQKPEKPFGGVQALLWIKPTNLN